MVVLVPSAHCAYMSTIVGWSLCCLFATNIAMYQHLAACSSGAGTIHDPPGHLHLFGVGVLQSSAVSCTYSPSVRVSLVNLQGRSHDLHTASHTIGMLLWSVPCLTRRLFMHRTGRAVWLWGCRGVGQYCYCQLDSDGLVLLCL